MKNWNHGKTGESVLANPNGRMRWRRAMSYVVCAMLPATLVCIAFLAIDRVDAKTNMKRVCEVLNVETSWEALDRYLYGVIDVGTEWDTLHRVLDEIPHWLSEESGPDQIGGEEVTCYVVNFEPAFHTERFNRAFCIGRDGHLRGAQRAWGHYGFW